MSRSRLYCAVWIGCFAVMLLLVSWEFLVAYDYPFEFAPHWTFELPCGFFLGAWLTARYADEADWVKQTILKLYLIGNIGFLVFVVWFQLDLMVNLVASLLITAPLLLGYVTQTQLVRASE